MVSQRKVTADVLRYYVNKWVNIVRNVGERMINPYANISSYLGYYVDGWADIIEGMGEKAENVKTEILQELDKKNMPDIKTKDTTLREGFLSWSRREYIVTTTAPAATTTIRTAKHGQDLFVSWTSFIRLIPNWRLLAVYGLISLIIGTIGTTFGSLFRVFEVNLIVLSSQHWNLFTNAFGKWLLFAAGIFVSLFVILVVLGRVIKQDEKAYTTARIIVVSVVVALGVALVVENIGQTMREEITQVIELYRSYRPPFQGFMDNIGETSWTVFMVILLLAMIQGLTLKRSALAYIMKEPSLFDQEDIVAMNLTVHKSMLRAVDLVGIDSSKLRLKRDFKGGRRGDNM